MKKDKDGDTQSFLGRATHSTMSLLPLGFWVEQTHKTAVFADFP